MMMNSLHKTLTKTLTLRLSLSAFSLSSNYSTTTKFPSDQPQYQAPVATEEEEEKKNHELHGGRAKNWARPSEIVFQPKVANCVNFIGTVRMPVQFVTLRNGNSCAGTIISQDGHCSSLRLLWIPIIFEGDLAHTAATHLKLQDTVYVAGQLSPDPLPINLTNDRVDVQVKVHDIHFVRAYHNMNKSIRR